MPVWGLILPRLNPQAPQAWALQQLVWLRCIGNVGTESSSKLGGLLRAGLGAEGVLWAWGDLVALSKSLLQGNSVARLPASF